MQSDIPTPETPQFSLRFLLTLTFAISVLLGLLAAASDWIAGMGLVAVSLISFSSCIAAVVYCRGGTRAFFIGALMPLSVLAISGSILANLIVFRSGYPFRDPTDILAQYATGLKLATVYLFAIAFVAGLLAYLVQRAQRPRR